MTRTCISCTSFDHATPRAEAASIVRCLEDRNRGDYWPKLVAGTYPACKHFSPTPTATAEDALCALMML